MKNESSIAELVKFFEEVKGTPLPQHEIDEIGDLLFALNESGVVMEDDVDPLHVSHIDKQDVIEKQIKRTNLDPQALMDQGLIEDSRHHHADIVNDEASEIVKKEASKMIKEGLKESTLSSMLDKFKPDSGPTVVTSPDGKDISI